MKFWAIVTVAGALALPAAAQTAVPKIAVIDVQKLVVESAAGKEAQGRVKKVIDAKQVDSEKLQKELQGLQQRLTDQGPSMTDEKRVLPVINQVGKEKGYTLIFNKYAPGMLVYADDAVDITASVVQRLDSAAAAGK